jgi:hypothetical protein
MKNYYDVHVNYGKSGYSLCVSSNDEIEDDIIISKISDLNKWEEKGDSTLVDSIEKIYKKEAIEWFDESRIINL